MDTAYYFMGMVFFLNKFLCNNNLVRISTKYLSEKKNWYFEPIYPNLPERKGQIVGILVRFENSRNAQMIPTDMNKMYSELQLLSQIESWL